MMWGVRIRSKSSGNEMNYWFDTQQQRDEFIIRFDKTKFEILEYMSEQMEMPFDVR